MQKMLNKFGFTDREGNHLKKDGIYGDRARGAAKKFNKYQKELREPSYLTKRWQQGLNNAGFRDAQRKPLKTDGIHGSKTDIATIKFENAFLGELDKETYKPKTISEKTFPTAPRYDSNTLIDILKQDNRANMILGNGADTDVRIPKNEVR